MTLEQIKKLGNSLGILVAVDRKGVVNLLKAYGVPVERQMTTSTIIDAFIKKAFTDPNFVKDAQQLMLANAKLIEKTSKNFNNFNSANALPSTTTSGGGSGFLSGFNLGDLISGGVNIWGSIEANKAQEKLLKQQAELANAQAAAQLQAGNQQLEIERLRLAQLQASKPTTNMTTYLIIGGVGLVVVIAAVAIFKK